MITKKKILRLEKIIGYSFKKKDILINSLTHPSILKEKKYAKLILNDEFERLEFLGDRVLGLAIASIIYKKFKNNREGDLSKKLSYLVQKNFLHKIALEISIDDFLIFNFKKNHKKTNMSILADSVESLIGAIYIDGGYNQALKFIKKIWDPYFDVQDSIVLDPKTNLQEISQQKFKVLPIYKLIKKTGPSHSPIFTISLQALKLKKILSNGTSIREAEKKAASILLKLYNEKKNLKS